MLYNLKFEKEVNLALERYFWFQLEYLSDNDKNLNYIAYKYGNDRIFASYNKLKVKFT